MCVLQISVIGESIDTGIFSRELWPPLPLPGVKRFRFLAVAKLEERKGWDTLIRAYLRVRGLS